MHLDRSMHSHKGCICLAFLHCVFSNESSNGLPEKMQSHIDCTGSLSFLFKCFCVFKCDLNALGSEHA